MGIFAITMYKGDTSLVVTVPAAVLATTNLSGYSSIWFTAKHSSNDADPGVFQKTLAGGNLVVSTAGSGTVNGVLTATLVDADTSSLYDLENGLPLVYDVKGKTAGGAEKTLLADLIIVLPHSTKAT